MEIAKRLSDVHGVAEGADHVGSWTVISNVTTLDFCTSFWLWAVMV